MSAYLIADVEITNESVYAQYRERMTPTLDAYGGKFVARGGEIEVIGGSWNPQRLAIVAFDNMEQARAWLASPEFKELDDMRTSSSNINLVLVEGV